MVRVTFTERQYGALMRIVQKKATETWEWEMSMGSMKRNSEYALIVEILEALRKREEVE